MSYIPEYDNLGLQQLEVGIAWKPTPHGKFLAVVLSGLDVFKGKKILELGAGVGNHTIPILRQEPSHLSATEYTAGDIAVTQKNVESILGDKHPIDYHVLDWLNLPPEMLNQYDILVTNPPFCKSGKRYRRYFIDELILNAHKTLKDNGELIFIQSSMADVNRSFNLMKENGFQEVRIINSVSGPFRDYYFTEKNFMEEISRVPGGFRVEEDGTHIESLSVLRGRLPQS